MDDHEVMEAYRQEEEPLAKERWAVELDARFRPVAERAAARFFRDPRESSYMLEDAVSDSMMKFIETVEGGTEVDNPGGLVWTTTTRVCISVFRRETAGERRFGPSPVDVELAPDPRTPETELEAVEQKRILMEELATLKLEFETHATALIWQLEERDLQELAVSRGVKVNTVHQWANRGRKWLESRLAKRLFPGMEEDR